MAMKGRTERGDEREKKERRRERERQRQEKNKERQDLVVMFDSVRGEMRELLMCLCEVVMC